MNCLCRPSRILTVKIYLLDDTDFIHEIRDDLPGQTLLDIVCSRLNLIETTYFGIRYIDDENQTQWLDPVSRLSRQLKIKPHPFKLYFGVKFYAADACKLVEEITRYQLFLQVKQDVLQSRLPVSFELAAELGAYAVQSELGDYDHRRHLKGYVSEFRLLANQTSELETRISELHQQLKGMSPATAELNYLDKVKWHDMYGVDLHPVLGEDSVEYFLGLTPSGIVVLRNKTKVAHYYWPRIAKVYYKGKYFMLRICDKNNELSTYGFETPRKSACKHLWRCCVEHHTFFRLVSSGLQEQTSPNDLISFSSRFRYSKRSSKEDILKSSNSIKRSPPIFVRVPSKRQPRRIMDDFLTSSKTVDSFLKKPNTQPKLYENQYRSTGSIPTTLGIRTNNGYHTPGYNTTTNASITPDSPRSTRSAPWTRTQQRGLFGNTPSSPRSVRSAVSNRNSRPPSKSNRYNRSSSVESHSSIDSCSARRNRQRYRRTSDNESEISHTSGKSGRSGRSGRSHNSHRKRRRSRHRRGDSGSENNSSVRTRARSYSGHRLSSSCSVASTELIDSTNQWLEVQRRQANGLHSNGVQQASVSKSSIVVKSLHSNDSHSDSHSYHKSRRHKKHHNSSSKSPSDSKNRIWSSELAKHLQFDLVDTAGMTEDQLREIPYTVIETKSNGKRVTSTNFKLSKSLSSGNTSCKFSPKESGNGSTRKDRVDRIRGLFIPNEASSGGNRNGSIRSASTLSSRECDKNSSLIRMMSSMSMGDFISPSVSSLSPQDNSALRVSHEHTDSGLGADQDYAYSSERSSDSARYGTNKSSGASSGSHHKTSGPFTSILSHNPKYNTSSSSYSDMLFQLKSTTYQPTNTNNNYNKATSVTTNTMNPNRSSSLEIILSPIVNSIPRMP
ncbi:EPB41L4A family protein [Megaselia abdita]